MRWLLWLGVLFLSTSWLFLVPVLTPPDITLGLVFLALGIVCNIVGLRTKDIPMVHRKYLLFLIPLVISLFFIPFPFSLGVLVFVIGLLLAGVSGKAPKYWVVYQLWPGMFFSSLVLLLQSFMFPVFVKIGARAHGSDLLASFAAWLGELIGLQMTVNSDTVFVGLIDMNPALVVSWESVGFFLWWNLFLGFVLLVWFLGKKKRIAISFVVFLLVSVLYLVIRYLSLLFVLVETMEAEEITFLVALLDIFYDPLFVFVSFIPFILLLMRFIPLDSFHLDFEWMKISRFTRKQGLAFMLVFLFGLSLVGAFSFQDPGVEKQGRILVDELHSNWEGTVEVMDTEWYGRLSTYNMYSWAEWLKHYYTIDQNLNDTLTGALLSQYDILVLKCPTNPYSDQEVEAIVDFVENGGGLYLIGDHTNVFGMNSYLNKVSRNFDIVLNTDATHEYFAPGGFSRYYPPSVLPHSIVPLMAEEVIIGDKLTTFPGTYATPAFFVEDKMWEQTRGIFLQTVAYKHGKGRVVVFSDSTVFSSYSIFLSGYQEFNLGTIEYLNRVNTYGYMNMVFLVLAIVSLGVAVFLLRKEAWVKILVIVIAGGVVAVSVAGTGFTYLQGLNYPIPSPKIEIEKRVCFDMEHSSGVISPVPSFAYGDVLNRAQKERYLTFYVWTQRVGCFPSIEDTLEDAIACGDLVVLVNPDQSFTGEEIGLLLKYVGGGGRLLVMETVYNFNSTANEVLGRFNMQVITSDSGMSAIVAGSSTSSLFDISEDYSVGGVTQPSLTVTGGRAILKNENGQVHLAVENYGKGIVAVFVDSSCFSQQKMGGVFTVPSEQLREVYDTEYYILQSLLFDEDDVEPVSVIGFVFEDVNQNNTYDVMDDFALLNASVSFWKIDTLNPGLRGIYSTSKEVVDDSGYYSASGMMPGYYLVSVSIDDILIHQSTLYLLSGSTSWYNLSMAESATFTGRTYVDTNIDSMYSPGEEFAQTTVALYYQKYNEQQVLVEEVETNSTGVFSFTGLIPGQYRFSAVKTNTTTGYLDYIAEGNLIFAENETKTYNVPLSLATVTVHGNVTFQNESKAGIIITFQANASVENNTAYPFIQVQTNQTGKFMLQLYPGYYNVSVNQTINESGQISEFSFIGELNIKIGTGQIDYEIALLKEEY